MQFAIRSCLSFAAALVLGGAAAKPAAGPRPTIHTYQTSIEATPEMAWTFDFVVVNPLDVGIYSDSAWVRLEDTSPAVTGVSKVHTMKMASIANGTGSVSAHDSMQSSHTIPAAFETGSLKITYFAHTTDGRTFVSETPVLPLEPGPTSKEHPSEFLEAGGQKVEVVTFRSRTEGPAPGVLFVHDHGSHARTNFPIGFQLSARGYTVMFVSLPGYGLSGGTPDPASAQTLAALGAALDRLKKVEGVDPARLAVWGTGRGATAAERLAESRGDLAGLVAQSGLYTGASPAKIRAATLVLHGAADAEAPAAQAEALAKALPAERTQTKVVVNGGHVLPRSEFRASVLPFLEAQLKKK